MKVILYLILTGILFIGCGVETSSSSVASSSSDTNSNGGTDTNSSDNGGADTNSTDTNSTDTNSTDTNTTDPVVIEDEDYGVSTYDPQACLSTGRYVFIRDNSLDPDGFFDELNGIKLTSYYPKTFNATESEIRLYHPSLENSVDDNLIFVFTSRYSFSFDTKWLDNTNRTIYMKTPDDENGDFYCFRYELNTTVRDDVKMVLVHSSE